MKTQQVPITGFRKKMTKKIIIGKEEWCKLPELGLPAIKARIDSGAKTSSLHAFNIHTFEEDGKKYVHNAHYWFC